ncbi:P68 family surface lipoprotein [Mycoplasmopsis arginini]|uniref:P68 family surface lipoprotein n=1 Tax=Mycoplasmopsis arginini TaxID=2094 RepID=UPI003D01CD30
MKKINKILLSVSGLTALALPLASASCGTSTARFEQHDDGILKIATGFSENGNQGVGLKTIVAAYNEWLNSGSDEEKLEKINKGYLPVGIHFQPNGYSTGTLSTKLNAKEQADFWNIMVNYPTAASILAQHDMNLSVSEEVYNGLGIEEAFKHVNDEIGGNVEKQEKWVIPFSRSSEMQSINMIVLGKLLKELKAVDGVVTESGEDKIKLINLFIDSYEKKQATDSAQVDKDWENSKAKDITAAHKAIKEMSLTLSDQMFYEYDSLIKFAIAAKRLYPNDLTKPIIGIDSLASVINVMNVAKSKGDKSKQYITPSPEHIITGGYDYHSFQEKGTAQNNLFRELLKTIYDGIETGALWIGGGGSYGSNLLTKHKMAISIGSTAGYGHTFVNETAEQKSTFYINDLKNVIQPPIKLSKPTDEETAKNIVLKFKSGKYTNNIYAYELSEGQKVGKFDRQFKDSESQTKVTSKFDENVNLRLLEADFDGNNLILSKDKKIELQDEQKTKVVQLGEIFKDNAKKYVLIDKSIIKEEKLSSDKLLNFDESYHISTPLVKSSEDKKSVFIQGPSLVLIHANEREDKATTLFVEWLFKENINSLTFGSGDKATTFNNIKAIDGFNRYGSYISPTVSYFSQTDEEVGKQLNRASFIAYKNFKLISTNPNEYQAAEDVSSVLSDSLRDAIGTAGRTITGAVSNKQTVTFEQFLLKINELFK